MITCRAAQAQDVLVWVEDVLGYQTTIQGQKHSKHFGNILVEATPTTIKFPSIMHIGKLGEKQQKLGRKISPLSLIIVMWNNPVLLTSLSSCFWVRSTNLSSRDECGWDALSRLIFSVTSTITTWIGWKGEFDEKVFWYPCVFVCWMLSKSYSILDKLGSFGLLSQVHRHITTIAPSIISSPIMTISLKDSANA